MQQLTIFDLSAAPKTQPAPIEFNRGDRVVGIHIKSGQTISGTVEQIGWKYLVLDGDRPIYLKTAQRSLQP